MNQKILFVYPRFARHAEAHPELLDFVPMNEYLGSPSLGIAMMAALTPGDWQREYRDDRLESAAYDTDADVVALSFFTPAAKRALELADWFRARGKTVIAGGIFSTAMPDGVQPHVDAVIVGEGEAVWRQVLRDLKAGTLQPRYERSTDVVLDELPLPDLSLYFGAETEGFRPDDYPVQLSRGCPLECEACILPVSMTRHLRCFPFDHVRGQLEQLDAVGKRAALTEDTSWLPGNAGRRLLDQMFTWLVETGRRAHVSYIGVSMPMLITAPEALLTSAKAAGVDMFYLVGGFDPITRHAFTGKHPRALERAFRAIERAHDAGIEPYTSFLLGNDSDDEGTVDRVLDFADRAGIRKAEFAIATPYPGTPRWKQLVREERITSRDWSLYNDANVVFEPAQLTQDQLLEGYLRLWKEFYATRGHFVHAEQAERTIQF